MTSILPIIPALFLLLLASYYSQNYACILASPLKMERFSYKGGCGIRERMRIETFKRRAGLGYR